MTFDIPADIIITGMFFSKVYFKNSTTPFLNTMVFELLILFNLFLLDYI